jgi:hypothetical protein
VLVVVAALLTAAAFWAILTLASHSSSAKTATSEASMRSLPPQERRYVKGVIALTPQQQHAAYSPATGP